MMSISIPSAIAVWAAFFANANAAPTAPPKPAYEPTDRYETRVIEGWTILTHRGFLESQPELAAQTFELLRFQLYQTARVVPAPALAKLKQIKIWVEEAEPHHPCMAYHPDPGWLRDHDMNPAKARCVEIANARTFLDWTKAQPWMVLHELAHGYHHQFLQDSFGNAAVAAAQGKAKASGTYNQALHIDGRRREAYALTNPMEYFAESSEAYFGTNDFFPFVRSELQHSDAEGFKLMKEMWSLP